MDGQTLVKLFNVDFSNYFLVKDHVGCNAHFERCWRMAIRRQVYCCFRGVNALQNSSLLECLYLQTHRGLPGVRVSKKLIPVLAY